MTQLTNGVYRPAEEADAQRKHSHPNSTEALYLLRGKLWHVLGGEAVLMQPGDTTAIPAGVPHVAFSVGNEDADMFVAYPTGQREFRPEA